MSEAAQTGTAQAPRRRWWIAAAPLVIFLALAGIFAKQLLSGGATNEIPSALIGREVPDFDLPPLEGLTGPDGQLPGISSASLKAPGNGGKVTLVNVWASWCAPCRAEHPFIMQLAEDQRITVTGLNYKDQTGNALRFLGQLGNPFAAVGVDQRGKATIDWGVYGVPETFIVDAQGRIVHKHVGPLNEKNLAKTFLPALEKAIAGN